MAIEIRAVVVLAITYACLGAAVIATAWPPLAFPFVGTAALLAVAGHARDSAARMPRQAVRYVPLAAFLEAEATPAASDGAKPVSGAENAGSGGVA